MGFAENYFFRHSFLIPQIMESPPGLKSQAGLLRYIVVIPSYLEKDIVSTLSFLKKAQKPIGSIEVITLINYSETDTDENKKWSREQYNHLSIWCEKNSERAIQFRVILAGNLPEKHFGAGLARKIGMDLALKRFDEVYNPQGLILSLDADAEIEDNYFTAIEETIDSHTDFGGCIINFAHALEGNEFGTQVYEAIVKYELYLRYYKHILNHIGFPFARYTIGSCFGIKALVYLRHGGMNRKKAGEDFYFLNKVLPHENFVDICNTCVHPSSRPSLRAAFGTGRVIHDYIHSRQQEFLTFHPEAFYELAKLFAAVDQLYSSEAKKTSSIFSNWSKALQKFLIENHFEEKVNEIQTNTANPDSFRKRFFLWFNGFRVVKYLNYVHRNYYTKIPVRHAVTNLLTRMNKVVTSKDERYLLKYLRKLDSVS